MASEKHPKYGKRLLPQILDGLALTEPDRIVYSLASFRNDAPHFRTITACLFAKAVDKTAWWLYNQTREQRQSHNEGTDESRGKTNKRILTIGYIGPRKLETRPCEKSLLHTNTSEDDLRHILLIYGAIKANCAVSFSVPRLHCRGASSDSLNLGLVSIAQKQC